MGAFPISCLISKLNATQSGNTAPFSNLIEYFNGVDPEVMKVSFGIINEKPLPLWIYNVPTG